MAPERRLDSRWGSTGIAALPIVCLALLTSTVVVDAQFSYSVEEGAVTITGYTGIGGVVIIPDTIEGLPVTGIEDRAFFNEESLTSVVIPASITHIGTAPLPFCPGLVGISVSTENTYFASEDGVLFNKNKSALIQFPAGKAGSYVIPASVVSIEDSAFGGAHSLAGITIGGGVANIADDAFYWCYDLTTVAIPDGVVSIGDDAFSGCHSLASVSIGSGLASLGLRVVEGCRELSSITVSPQNQVFRSVDGVLFNKVLTQLIRFPEARSGSFSIPATVLDIDIRAFIFSKIEDVQLPSSLTNISVGAFSNCHRVGTMIIGNEVRNIGGGAFFGCENLTNVVIGTSVTNIGAGAFQQCSNLPKVSIPDGVKAIGNGAFYLCSSLSSVTIGRSLIELPRAIFDNCSQLTGVYFRGDAPFFDAEAFDVDESSQATVFYLPNTTGWSSTFAGRPTLLWNPAVQTNDPDFGVLGGQFGFKIHGTSDLVVVVEAASDLANPIWSPVSTNTLTGGSSFFSDSEGANVPGRFYRLGSP